MVFLFSQKAGHLLIDDYSRLAIGIVVLMVGVIWLVFFRRKVSFRTSIGRVFLILWGVVWSATSLLFCVKDTYDYFNLSHIYEQQQYQVAEGTVHVLHTQPADGHDQGDIITINDVQFEVDYYFSTFGYTTTISHGGVLQEGTYARLYYWDGTILRVDVGK